MEVAPAETEGADRAPSQMVAATNPGTSFRVDVQRTLTATDLGVRRRDLESRRQNLVMQRQRDLDQAGRTCGRLGVPDLRLHGAEGAPLPSLRVRGFEDRHEATHLGGVSRLRGGTVALDQLDRGRAVVSLLVCANDRVRLSLRAGCINAGPLAVRRSSQASYDGVNRIAIGLGVLEAPEREHPHALTDEGAVGLGRKGSAVARR